MNELVIMITTALISGLLATVITLIWQRIAERKDRKIKIFETLMAYRYMISSEESVKALNSIDIIFYDNPNVRKAYAAFLDETDKDPEKNPNVNIEDKQLKLLEEMSNVLRYKNLQWDTIKRYYYPIGLSNKLEEEALLRKLQIETATDVIENKTNTSSNEEFSQQLAMQILPEIIKDPDKMKNLINLADQIK